MDNIVSPEVESKYHLSSVRIVLKCMYIFGFFHSWKRKGVRKIMRCFSITYSVIVLILCLMSLAFIVEALPAKLKFDFETGYAMLSVLWAVQSTASFILLFVSCLRESCIPQLLKTWLCLCNTTCNPRINRQLWIMVVVCAAYYIGVSSAMVVPNMGRLINAESEVWMGQFSFIKQRWLFIICYVLQHLAVLYQMALLIFPAMFLYALTLTIKEQMKSVIKILVDDIADMSETREIEITKYQKDYEEWCKIPQLIDNIFRLYFAINLAIGIPMVCFLGYIAYFRFHFLLLFGLLSNVFGLIALCFPATMINAMVYMIIYYFHTHLVHC